MPASVGSGRWGMLVVETIGRIRREHLVKGRSIKEIARDLKVSRNTVRKVLRSGETSFSYEREIQPRPKIGRWKTEIDRMLLTKNAEASVRLPLFVLMFDRGTIPPSRPAFLDRHVSQFGWSAVSPSRPALSQSAACSGRQGKRTAARSHAQPPLRGEHGEHGEHW